MRRVSVSLLTAILLIAGCQRGALRFDGDGRPVFSQPGTERVAFASTDNGNLFVLAADAKSKRLWMAMSHDGGDGFMPPVPVSAEGAAVNYRSENGPTLLARGMSAYALWQQNRPEGGADIVFASQSRMGTPFSPAVSVLDKSSTDHSFNGFSSMVLAPNGDIYVVWLDGRDPGQPQGTFSLYLARSNDKGQTFGKNVRIASGVCPCCRPAISVSDDGKIYVAWRKVFDGDIRDIVVARSDDGGETFSTPVKAADDRWLLHACPDSGPALKIANGRVYMAWFSEGNGHSGIRFVTSSDAAQHFSSRQIVSSGVTDPNHPALDVDSNGNALIVFQGRDERAKNGWGAFSTYAVKVDSTGKISAPQPVPGGEGSSYPAVIVPGLGRAIIGWTRGHEENASVMLARTRL
jgi:hypothetical protein